MSEEVVLVRGGNPLQKPDRLFRARATRLAALPPESISAHIREGWKCVRFEFCVSFLVATIRCQSAPLLTANWRDRVLWALGYSALALLLGPWGIPWGPVWTIRAVWTNLTGGGDATEEVLAHLHRATAGEKGQTGDQRNPDTQ
jgi:hypothetical protein